MPAKNQTLANSLLSAVLRNVAYSSPAAVYAGLYTVAPTSSTTGTEVVTAGGTLYARVAVTFGAPVAGVTSNTGSVTFPVAGAPWGTVVAVAISDNATVGAGNQLYFGNLSVSKAVGTGDQVSFAISALSVTEQ